jgi:Mn2+/Fe2+ NRAMP family transporter
VLGVAIVLIPGVPLFPLMWFSQSVNAILLPVLLVLVLSLANDKRLMGRWTNSRLQNVLAWVLTGLIILTTVFLFASPLMS